MTVESNYVIVIGLKDSRWFFNQWKAKPKPVAPCTRDCSRASSELQVIARNCDWFIALSVPVVIGRSSGFGFSTVNWKPLYRSWIYWMHTLSLSWSFQHFQEVVMEKGVWNTLDRIWLFGYSKHPLSQVNLTRKTTSAGAVQMSLTYNSLYSPRQINPTDKAIVIINFKVAFLWHCLRNEMFRGSSQWWKLNIQTKQCSTCLVLISNK